jgi:chromosome partitioning protein
MQTITVASTKGGVGATTLACCLAWRASLKSGRVAAIDLNADQGNFSQWCGLRDQPLKGLHLVEDRGDLVETVPRLAAKYEWCIIDTMKELDVIEIAALVCDVLIIPIKTSIYDAAAIIPMIEIARERRKPFTFVLSDLDSHYKTLNAEVRAHLEKLGPVWVGKISHLQSYIVAPSTGRVGPEIDTRAKAEIEALWVEAQRLIAEGLPSRRGEGRANV